MDLDGEVIPGIENLHEKREALAFQAAAENLFAFLRPEVVEGGSGQFPCNHHRLLTTTV